MTTECPFEPNVLEAVTNDAWTESLRAHVASCDDCAAAAEVGSWMARFSGLDEREHVLPDPAVLWLKAKLLQSKVVVERGPILLFGTLCRLEHLTVPVTSDGPRE